MSKKSKFKFDVVIGNPPYQEETASVSERNGQKSVKNIFQFFQINAEKVARKNVILIYPGGRWIHRSGKGLSNFGFEQINDKHLKELTFYPNSNEIFENIGIPDGISIVLKDMTKKNNSFKYNFVKNGQKESIETKNPGKNLMPLDPKNITIVNKIDDFVVNNNIKYLHKAILPRSLFNIESSFAEDNPNKIYPYKDEFDKEKFIKLFTNDKSGKAGRATWYLADKDVIQKNIKYVYEYQVVVSSANAGGQKRDNQLEIMGNNTAFGRSRVALRSFKTYVEAKNFKKYVSCYVIKYTFLMTDESLTSLGKRVPDILNYTDKNDLIDFSTDVDVQLCSKIGLNKDEFTYIKDYVDNFRKVKEMD